MLHFIMLNKWKRFLSIIFYIILCGLQKINYISHFIPNICIKCSFYTHTMMFFLYIWTFWFIHNVLHYFFNLYVFSLFNKLYSLKVFDPDIILCGLLFFLFSIVWFFKEFYIKKLEEKYFPFLWKHFPLDLKGR